MPREKIITRESYRSSADRHSRYPPPEPYRDRRYDNYREPRMPVERPEMMKIPSSHSRPQRESYSNYGREPYEQYPPPPVRMNPRDHRGYYKEPSPYGQRYINQVEPSLSHREEISRVMGKLLCDL